MKKKGIHAEQMLLGILLSYGLNAWSGHEVKGESTNRTVSRRTGASSSSSGPVSTVHIAQGRQSADPTTVPACSGDVGASKEIPAGLIRQMFANLNDSPSIEYTEGGKVRISMPAMINRCDALYEIETHAFNPGNKKYLSLNFVLKNGVSYSKFLACLNEIEVDKVKFFEKSPAGDGFDNAHFIINREGIINRLPDSDFLSSKSVEHDPAEVEGREIVLGTNGPAYANYNGSRNDQQVYSQGCFYAEKAGAVAKVVNRHQLIAEDYRKRLEDTMQESTDSADCARRINEMLRQLLDSGSSTSGPITEVIKRFEDVRDELYKSRIRELADQLESASNQAVEGGKPETAFEGINNEESLQLLSDYIEDVINPSVDRLQKLYNDYRSAKSKGERENSRRLLEKIKELTRKIKSYASPFDSGDDQLDFEDSDQIIESTLLDSLRLAGRFKLADKISEIVAMGKFSKLLGEEGSDHSVPKSFEQMKTKITLLKRNTASLNRIASDNYTKMKRRDRLITDIKRGKTTGISEQLFRYASEANYHADRSLSAARSDINRHRKEAAKRCDYYFWTEARVRKCQRAQVTHERFASRRLSYAQRQAQSYRTRGQAYRGRGETVRGWEVEGERYLAERSRKRGRSSWDPFFDLENDSVFTGGRDFTFRSGYDSYSFNDDMYDDYDSGGMGQGPYNPQMNGMNFSELQARGIAQDPRLMGQGAPQFQQQNPMMMGQQNGAMFPQQQMFQGPNPYAQVPMQQFQYQQQQQQPWGYQPQNYNMFPR